MYSYGPPHMAGQKQDDQLKHSFSSYVRIRDVALKTYQRRWTIGRSGERGSGDIRASGTTWWWWWWCHNHWHICVTNISICVRTCVCATNIGLHMLQTYIYIYIYIYIYECVCVCNKYKHVCMLQTSACVCVCVCVFGLPTSTYVCITNLSIYTYTCYKHCHGVCQWSGRMGFNPRLYHTKDSKKWHLMHPCLIQHYKVRIKGKWRNPRKGVVFFPTLRCCSYWKESLWVTLDNSRSTFYLL